MELDTLNYVIEIYEDHVDKLILTGIGYKTEYNTVVTEKLISNIINRMNTLKARRMHLLKY